MTDLCIKQLSFSDYDLLQVFWDALLKYSAIESEFLDLKGSIESVNSGLKSEGSIILGEIYDNSIRGIAFLDIVEITRGLLSYLIVLPEFRRKGIGSALYKKSEEIFAENYKTTVRIPIHKISSSNQKLLEKNHYNKLRETFARTILFEKKL